jgi:hypothetical protein
MGKPPKNGNTESKHSIDAELRFEAGSASTEQDRDSDWEEKSSAKYMMDVQDRKHTAEIKRKDKQISSLAEALAKLETPESIKTDIAWLKVWCKGITAFLAAMIGGFFWFVYGPYESGILTKVDNLILKTNKHELLKLPNTEFEAKEKKTDSNPSVGNTQNAQ